MLKRNAPSQKASQIKRRKVSQKKNNSVFFEKGTYLGIEKKFLDTDVSLSPITTAASLANIVVVPQNDTSSGRDGRKILIKSIDLRGNFDLIPATNVIQTSEVIRVTILKDTQTNKAAFNATDWLVTDSYRSFSNLANNKRFQVLMSKDIALKAGGGTPTGAAYGFSEDTVIIKEHIKCNIPIEYDSSATTGAIGTQTQNSLWVVYQGSTGNAIARVNCRIRYTDA